MGSDCHRPLVRLHRAELEDVVDERVLRRRTGQAAERVEQPELLLTAGELPGDHGRCRPLGDAELRNGAVEGETSVQLGDDVQRLARLRSEQFDEQFRAPRRRLRPGRLGFGGPALQLVDRPPVKVTAKLELSLEARNGVTTGDAHTGSPQRRAQSSSDRRADRRRRRPARGRPRRAVARQRKVSSRVDHGQERIRRPRPRRCFLHSARCPSPP